MDLLLPIIDFPLTEIQNWINVQMSYSRQNSQVLWWQRLLAGLQKTRIQESEIKWTKNPILTF